MNTTRLVAALAAVVGITGLLATTATADDHDAVRDGTWFGYVRDPGRADDDLAVDLAGDGAGEMLLDAGLLARLDLVTVDPQPFSVIVLDDTIIELRTADDGR